MSNSRNLPNFWWLISEADRVGYSYMRTFIKNYPEKNQRNKRISSFTEMLKVIRHYAIRGDNSDANRCLVCGILWLPGAIAINTHQLGFLLSKCKSSINGSLQILGYKETMKRKNASDLISNSLTAIRNNRGELRKWTIRCQVDGSSQFPVSNLLDAEDSNPENEMNSEEEHNEKVEINQGNPNVIKIEHLPSLLSIETEMEPQVNAHINDSFLGNLDFSKEDAILSNTLSHFEENNSLQNDFWNDYSISNDSFSGNTFFM